MCGPHATAQQFCPSLEPGPSSAHSNSWKQWKPGLSEESKSGIALRQREGMSSRCFYCLLAM